MPFEAHSLFKKPSDEDALIWRYMDFTKFVSILDREAIFFAPANQLEDQFEGAYSKRTLEDRVNWANGMPAEALERLGGLYANFRRCTYISAWHQNPRESVAMWKLYLTSLEGIAVRSTYGRLVTALEKAPEKVHIGLVKYVDYDDEIIPEGNSLGPFVYKRASFEHEKELRAVIQDPPMDADSKVDWASLGSGGKYVAVNIDTLIEKVYIAPTSPIWFRELVQSVVKRFGRGFEVHQSALDAAPLL